MICEVTCVKTATTTDARRAEFFGFGIRIQNGPIGLQVGKHVKRVWMGLMDPKWRIREGSPRRKKSVIEWDDGELIDVSSYRLFTNGSAH
jgi:hypothetical protein